MTFHFLIQARLGSTRFPAKVLSIVRDETTLIEQVIHRVRQSKTGAHAPVTVLTSTSPVDDRLALYLTDRHIEVARGDEHDVFDRFHSFVSSLTLRPDYIVRVCSDNPCVDPVLIDSLAESVNKLPSHSRPDYLSHRSPDGRPAVLTHWGFFVEMIRTEAFLDAAARITTDAQREHVTPIFYQSDFYRARYIPMPAELPSRELRFTVDTPADLARVAELLRRMRDPRFTYKDVCRYAKADPEMVVAMSAEIETNAKGVLK